jgi:hypothetical protein
MALTFQVENWHDVKEEMSVLWPIHWEEIANDKERIKLDVWMEAYDLMSKMNQLHIVTVRNEGTIVGYHWSIVRPHLHYKNSLTAYTDIYFLLPAYRKGFTGVKLFKYVEETLKGIGVEKMYTASKTKSDKSSIFERLGWTRSEVVYTKYIGDK